MDDFNKPTVLFVVPLGCDLLEGGSELGSDSLARCKVAAQEVCVARKSFVHVRTIVSPGFSPDVEEYPYDEKSMAELMNSALESGGVDRNEMLMGKEVWGTVAEIVEARKVIFESARLCEKCFVEVRFVSSWYHIPRLKLICRKFFKENSYPLIRISWKVVSAPGKWKHALWEPLKLLRELFRKK